jgi:type VI secretion system protein VasI
MVTAPASIGLLATAACCVAVTTSAALAENDTVAARLHGCAAIHDNVDRLACYDKAFAQPDAIAAAPRPQASQAPAAAPSPNAPSPKLANNNLMVSEDQVGWTNKETTSGLDNSKTEIAILPAATAKLSRFAASGSPQHAALIIRCREGKTDLYVAYTDVVDGMEHSIDVQYRIGAAPVRKERWGISQDVQSYGTWQTAATVPFIKSLLSADEFYVRGDAGSMGTSEALFKLSGIDGAIAPVRAACHW